MYDRPFRFWCQKVLPLVYDDSLSYYELLCKVVDYLNNIIDDVKNLSTDIVTIKKQMEELKYYVEHYFDDYDVQGFIDNKIDALIQSGAFQEMLMKAVGMNTGVLVPEYLGTRYFRMTDSTYNESAIDYTKPAESEGFCSIEGKTFVCFFSPFADGITETSDTLVEEFDFSSFQNPLRKRSVTVKGIQHSNGATYADGKIYVAMWGYYNSGSAVPQPKIGVLDYNTLSLTDTITVSGIPAVQKICYDAVQKKFYSMNGRDVYSLNLSTKTATKLFTIKVPVSSSQGMCCRDGILYISNGSPFGISVHSVAGDGSVLRYINISNIDNCEHYAGRIADIDLVGNTIYGTTHQVVEQANYGVNPETNPTIYANYFYCVGVYGGQTEGSTNANTYQNLRTKIDTTVFEDKLIYCNGSDSYPLATLGEYLLPSRFPTRILATNTIYYRGVLPLVDKVLTIPDNIQLRSVGLYMKNASLSCDNMTTVNHYEIYDSACNVLSMTCNENDNNVIDHSTATFDIKTNNVVLNTATIRTALSSGNVSLKGGQSHGVVLKYTSPGTTLDLSSVMTSLAQRVGVTVTVNGATNTALVYLNQNNTIDVNGTKFTITHSGNTLTFSTAPSAFEIWFI